MKRQDESFAPFFELSTDFLIVIDKSLMIVRANPAFESLYGSPGLPAEGRSILDFVAQSAHLIVRQALVDDSASPSSTLDVPLVQRDQQVRMCEWSVAFEPVTRNRFVVLRDVSLRRRLEQELLNSQKLDAVGQLAAGIAHEINTPIQYVGSHLGFLAEASEEVFAVLTALVARDEAAVKQEFPDFEFDFLRTEVPKALEQSCEGIQRVAEIVRGMREFAHRDHGMFAPTDVNAALERTLVVCRNEWRYVAVVEQNLGVLPLVSCLAGGIRQVLLNLICNAAHAIHERNTKTGRKQGCITITTSSDAEFVTVAIRDDGQGMPGAVKSRVFEPFFTTKEVGKGTGQGLALSRAIIVEKHGGALTFESEEGAGSTFFVKIPIVARPHAHREAAA